MTTARPVKLRALTSNRPWALPGVSKRSGQYRRFRDLCEAFAKEFSEGAERTEAQLVAIRNAAMAALAAETMQARLVNGELVDPDAVVRLAGASTRAIDAVCAHMPPPPPPLSIAEQLHAERQAVAA